jgi:hypothetical protein
MRRQALRIATGAAADGGPAAALDAVQAAGLGHVFPDRLALAVAAEEAWWRRLVGRLDGDLDDSRHAADVRATVQETWAELSRLMIGHRTLVAPWVTHPEVVAVTRRHARLLAMLAGRVAADADAAIASDAGLELIAELEQATALAPRRSKLRAACRRWRRRPDAKLARIAASAAFATCHGEDMVALGRAADLLATDAGEVLVSGARPGQWWWFVLEGTVDLVTAGRTVTQLTPGDSVGPEPPGLHALGAVDLVAHDRAALLVARRREIDGLLADRPELAAAVQGARHRPPAPADDVGATRWRLVTGEAGGGKRPQQLPQAPFRPPAVVGGAAASGGSVAG